MVNINFVPDDYVQSKESHRTSILYLVLLAVVMAGLGGVFMTIKMRQRGLKAKEGLLNKKLAQAKEAIEQFEEAYRDNILYRVIGTNAVYHNADLLDREWYLNADVDDLFARSIYRIHYNLSLSSLMDNTKIIKDLLEKNSKRSLPGK